MKTLTAVGLLAAVVYCSSALATDPHHPMPDRSELNVLISEKCAHLDAALTKPGASDRCVSRMLDEFNQVRTLASDDSIPDLVWISCRQESGSMQTANFGLWSKCLRVAKAGCALETEYVGIGVVTESKNGAIFVKSTRSGSPAEEAGLRQGDALVEVAGQPVTGQTLPQVSQRMKGPLGTDLALTIRAPDGQTRALKVRRAAIRIPSENQLAMLTCVQMIQTRNWIYNREVR